MSEPRFVILLAEDAGVAGELKRIALAMLGTWYKGKQKIAITKAMLADVVANFRKRGTGEVAIDYDHAIEFAAGAGDPVPAAGWIKSIDDAPDNSGVLWGSVEWTERAAEMIRKREYKYLSPVIDPRVRDNKTGDPQGWTLTSAALTNTPVLQELPAIAMSEAGWSRGDAGKEQNDVKKVILADRVARTVRVVADDDTESVLTVEGLEAPPAVLRLSEVKRGAEGLFDFASLDMGGDRLVASEVVRAMLVQGELGAAVEKGLITPAQRPFYEKMALSDLPAFRALVSTMKPVVDLKEHGIGSSGEGLSELQKVEAQLDAKVKEKLAGNSGMLYHTALKLVASENRDLDLRRTDLIRRKGGND
jgi:phage I-like protein